MLRFTGSQRVGHDQVTEPAILCNIICDIHYFVLIKYYILKRASLVAQTVKCLPAMRETWVQSVIPFFL